MPSHSESRRSVNSRRSRPTGRCTPKRRLGRWPEERAAAMAVLEQPPPGSWPRDRSVLVAVLLSEGDVARAWRRRTPAAARATSGARSPANARPAPRGRAPPSTDGCSRPRSTCATTLATTARSSCSPSCTPCSRRMATRPRTLALVADLAGVHRRKRNLIKRLDAQRWPVSCPRWSRDALRDLRAAVARGDGAAIRAATDARDLDEVLQLVGEGLLAAPAGRTRSPARAPSDSDGVVSREAPSSRTRWRVARVI